jgi:hypothetical protein
MERVIPRNRKARPQRPWAALGHRFVKQDTSDIIGFSKQSIDSE